MGTNGDEGPQHLHQIMIVDGMGPPVVPPPIDDNAKALRAAYPFAQYRLWDGISIRKMLSANFGQDVVTAYDTLQPYSYKCNLARYCLLYQFGGVYADLGIKTLSAIRPPAGIGVASFRDYDLLSPCWTAASTSVILAKPGRKEFEIAIKYILENCRNRYYGANPLYVSGPVVWGRSLIAAKADKKQRVDADDQWIGVCRPATPGQSQENVCFIAPDHSLVAIRVKGSGGDLTSMGAAGTNNYNTFWHSRSVYGEDVKTWAYDDPSIHILPEFATRTATGIAAKPGAYGSLMYGPYVSLKQGSYRLTIRLDGSHNSLPRLKVAVSHSCGTVFHIYDQPETIGAQKKIIFEFSTAQDWTGVEFKFEICGPTTAEIRMFTLEIT